MKKKGYQDDFKIETNSKGNKIGYWKYYYSNGQIKTQGKYKDGEREGEWINYNELGDIVITYLYKEGKEYKRDGIKVNY